MIWYIFLLNEVSAMELFYSLSIEEYIIFSVSSMALVCFGGLMSGLTVGLLSIDEMQMEIKLCNGTSEEKAQARRVLNTTENHHLLLVTLLLANAACMETLPILLNKMVGEIFAVAISVTFVLVFGEVLPQALCTGPDQIKIASRLCPFVRVLMILLFPLSYPIAKLLDRIFGHHEKGKKLRNDDLKILIALHHNIDKKQEERDYTGLVTGQINIIHGTIDLRKKKVKDCMIPNERVFTMSNKTILDRRSLKMVVKQGYSRVPIFEDEDRNKILGILLVKRLILLDNGAELKFTGIKLREPVYVSPDLPMLDLLHSFKGGASHMAIVKEGTKALGIITLEDLFEEIIKSEILDEDEYDKTPNRSLVMQSDKMKQKKSYGFKKNTALQPLIELDETE